MSNTVYEFSSERPLYVEVDKNVQFDTPSPLPAGIAYDSEQGIITFYETGQYLVQWWIATETALKGAIAFELQLAKRTIASGRSPIKTGQVAGFGEINVTETDNTLSLVNKSDANTMLSRKTQVTAYMLITQIGTPCMRVYRGDISAAGSSLQVPLANLVYYRLRYLTSSESQLSLVSINDPVRYDFRRFASFDGAVGLEGEYSDSAMLSGSTIKDLYVYKNSREIHWVLLRVENPNTNLWSTYEIRFFSSNGGARTTIWVNTIEEDVSY